MGLRTTLKALFGTAWHVQGDNAIDGMTVETDGTVEANKPIITDSNKDVTGVRNLTVTGAVSGVANASANSYTVTGPVGTGAATAGVLNLNTAELTVVAQDQLGRIDFTAPLEASGTDAILTGASIVAEAAATFDTTHNTTDLVILLGNSEAPVEVTRFGGAAGLLTHKAALAVGSNATDRVTMKGIYMNPSVVAVAVPTIANDAAENVDRVAVDVSASFAIQPAVGDAVIAIPMEALPTDCVLLGAYVTATDQITISFGSIEGGGGVTGANKNFNFLVIDLT